MSIYNYREDYTTALRMEAFDRLPPSTRRRLAENNEDFTGNIELRDMTFLIEEERYGKDAI